MTRTPVDVRSHLSLLFGMAVVTGYLLVTIWTLTRWSYDIAGVFLVGPVLTMLSIPLLARARRTEPDPWVGQLFTLSLLAMVFAGFVQFFFAFVYYSGDADVVLYSAEGKMLATWFWHGGLVPQLTFPLIGTGFISVLTGIIYTLIGPTIVGAFVLYSWLAFWGLYFCYRAFRTSIPDADYRRYAALVLFLPSLLFWSSGIGKGAWMTLCIGLALLGVARLISTTPRAVLPLLSGLGGSALVRPHITALLVVALVAGVLARRTVNANLLTPIVRVSTVGILVVCSAVMLSFAASFLKLDTLSLDSVEQVRDTNLQNTGIGGSTFTAIAVRSPLDLPWAATTVLFRPFLWEAKSLVILTSAVESFLLVLFFALTWRRWCQVPRLLRRYPYVMTALVAVLLFVVAFSTVGNFGLVVRQRVMILPLLLIFLCLPRQTPAIMNDVGHSTMERKAIR
jgi:hypothetical protein